MYRWVQIYGKFLSHYWQPSRAKALYRCHTHLSCFGLIIKDSEHLTWWSGGRTGPCSENGRMHSQVITRRKVFYCGKIVRHFPVCRWLHVGTGIMKHRTSVVTKVWDDQPSEPYFTAHTPHEVGCHTKVSKCSHTVGSRDFRLKNWLILYLLLTGKARVTTRIAT